MGIYEGALWITDLDGTLLDRNKKISEENKEAIAQFVRQGGKYAVATGRSPASAGQWLKQLPVNYPCIFYNGSMVKEIIAVGDYENDIGMIKEADFGVAMGNAQEHVKEAADYVCQDHNHHPMADILNRIGNETVF